MLEKSSLAIINYTDLYGVDDEDQDAINGIIGLYKMLGVDEPGWIKSAKGYSNKDSYKFLYVVKNNFIEIVCEAKAVIESRFIELTNDKLNEILISGEIKNKNKDGEKCDLIDMVVENTGKWHITKIDVLDVVKTKGNFAKIISRKIKKSSFEDVIIKIKISMRKKTESYYDSEEIAIIKYKEDVDKIEISRPWIKKEVIVEIDESNIEIVIK